MLRVIELADRSRHAVEKLQILSFVENATECPLNEVVGGLGGAEQLLDLATVQMVDVVLDRGAGDLASPAAAYVTGAQFVIDGGSMLGRAD